MLLHLNLCIQLRSKACHRSHSSTRCRWIAAVLRISAFQPLCSVSLLGWSSHDPSARGQSQDSVLGTGLAHTPGSTLQHPAVMCSPPLLPCQHALPKHPGVRRDNTDIPTQFRAGDRSSSPSQQPAVVCRAGCWCEVSLTWVM